MDELAELDAYFKSTSGPIELPEPVSSRILTAAQCGPAQRAGLDPYGGPANGQGYAQALLEMETDDYDDDDDDEAADPDDDDASAPQEALDLASRTSFVYQRYEFPARDSGLPIERCKRDIVESVARERVTVVEGATGCGKSTQIPQWILADARERGRHCNVVVTQPRRIAAISVAERVAQEFKCELGDLIGYQIGLEKKTSQDTRLQYVTTGVLLQQIINNKSLRLYTHIVLDEVHERDKDMDFLLIVVRKLLRTNSKSVKLVLMSATFNIERFSAYFAAKSYEGAKSAHVISVPERRNPSLKVSVHYLEQLAKLGALPEIDFARPRMTRQHYEFAIKLLNAFEKIDAIEEAKRDERDRRPCVLVFLPGMLEIEEMFKLANSKEARKNIDPSTPPSDWWPVPLHSLINREEQVKAFQKPPAGHRKIIFSTNIAESSITVTDVKYVIDFCLTRLSYCNPETNFSSLQLTWASHANCKQRAGRAGRVRSGKVYRIIYSDMFNQLPDECLPEMQRTNLENLILSAKLLDMGTPKYILAHAMDPPDIMNIYQTCLSLKESGALLTTVNGELSTTEDGDITYLGKIMARLPLDVRISKLIMLGHLFGCLQDAIIIGAAISTKNLFSNPFMGKMNAFNSKLTWAFGSTSDCIAFLNVYKVYKRNKAQRLFGNDRSMYDWAKGMYVQMKALMELEKLVAEIEARLKQEDIISEKRNWSKEETTVILKTIIAGAFYPNYFVFSNMIENDGREATKMLNGRDPYNTVYLTNMDNRQPGALYASQLKKVFVENTKQEPIIDFDINSNKVFVTFPSSQYGNDAIPGKISVSVYKAIKMRQLNVPLELRVLPLNKSIRRAAEIGIHPQDARSSSFSGHHQNMPDRSERELPQYLITRLPGIDESYIPIAITSYVTCGHFWATYDDENTLREMNRLAQMMNSRDVVVPLNAMPVVGNLYAAPYALGHMDDMQAVYYRALVEAVNDEAATVFFIDYGNRAEVGINDLQAINPHNNDIFDIRPFAFECVLSEISPSLSRNPRGVWTKAADARFEELTKGKRLYGKIFSVVFSVVSLELIDENRNINDALLLEGHAQVSEESYASKMNRDLRDRAREFHPSEIRLHNNAQIMQNMALVSQIIAPDLNECTERINLKGPHSPLEATLHCLFHSTTRKCVNIERESVNSVLLNSDFHCLNEQMLVASTIGESASGDNFTLRNTTLMPNIPGLPAIMALVFCPTAELRCDSTNSFYTAALCGLGHRNGTPVYPEHDIVVNINVEITDSDLVRINTIRNIINTYWTLTPDGQSVANYTEEFKDQNWDTLKRAIKGLISARRKQHNFTTGIDAWQWNAIPTIRQKQLDVGMTHSTILTLHNGIHLDGQSTEMMRKLAKENAKLHDVARNASFTNRNVPLRCNLCGTGTLDMQCLRLHLHSRLHRDRENDLPDVNAR